MRHPLKVASLVFAAVGLLLSARSAHSYSINAWGPMTGARTLALNPFFYGAFDPFDFSADLVVSYGVSDNVDVFADVASLSIAPDFDYAGSWVMGRYDFGGSNIIAAQLGLYSYDGSTDPYLTPQYHFFREGDRFAWEINAGIEIPLKDAKSSYLFGIFAPVFKVIPDTLSVFVEVDPSYQFGDFEDFILSIVPGLCVGFAENKHQISVGLTIEDLTESEVGLSYAAWYWTSFEL